MCYESSKRKFDEWFDDMGNSHPEWKEWLEWEPKERWIFSYDGGHRYGNITTNLSESLNHVLKGACALHVSTLIQLTFFRTNVYFVKQKDYANDYTTQGKL
jgi:transposase-like protein